MPRLPDKPYVPETPAVVPPVPAAAFLDVASPPPAPTAGVAPEPAEKLAAKPAADELPTCHYCGCPMVKHDDPGGVKDGCWHAENGCCFLPGRRELRPGHPPCDAYTAATAEK